MAPVSPCRSVNSREVWTTLAFVGVASAGNLHDKNSIQQWP